MLGLKPLFRVSFFFFNDTATTEIYTLSLHDAFPISIVNTGASEFGATLAQLVEHVTENHGVPSSILGGRTIFPRAPLEWKCSRINLGAGVAQLRSEEHTSELQSRLHLVCLLLLEKKKHTSELQSRLHLVCRLLLEKKNPE